MDFFSKSTHARGLLTKAQIDEIRAKIHSDSAVTLPDGTSWLTLEEAELIRRFYQAKISDVCAFLKLPKFIQVASMLYFWLTCILLATKIENLHLSTADFTNKIPNCQPSLITDIELVLLEALHFNILFFHPHSALHGFSLVFEADNDTVKDATRLLDFLVTTDALLIETPSHLALSSFNMVIPDRVATFIDERLATVVDVDELRQRLATISTYAQPPTPFDTNRLKDIDRKLHSIRSSLN